MNVNLCDRYLSSNKAADLLGYSHQTMKQSRSEGVLAGVEAPLYKKMGRRVVYEIGALEEWVSQFEDRTCTR